MITTLARLAPHRWRLALLILIPLLANGGVLTGFVQCDPEMAYSQLVTITKPALMQGAACFVDPGVGAITQPLGYLSAQDWLHGIVPWWNPYSGVGMPLAAEMQPESFFLPFVLLLHFHTGWLIQHILFQIFSALFTYAFLLEIGLTLGGAFLGAGLFSLNGTFFLTPGAVSAPIMFLPMLMLGIELALKAAIRRKAGGWSIIVLAVAGSIYAGFPMVAYFDGLLATAWSLLRLFQLPHVQRMALLGKLCIGGAIGIAVSAPLLNAFLQNLQASYLGIQVISGNAKLPPMAAPLQLFPLIFGALAKLPPPGLNDHGLWIRIGGWLGCLPVLLALYGLIQNHRQRAVKLLLAGWIIVFQARYFNAPGLITIFNLIPGVGIGDIVRFSTTASEFAIAALAALGYRDLEYCLPLSRRRASLLFIGFFSCVAIALFPVRGIMGIWFKGYPDLSFFSALFMGTTAIACVALAAIFVTRRLIIGAQILTIAGAISVALIGEGGAARAERSDPSVLSYLQNSDFLSRFYTLGPIMPNIAAGYGIASINYLALPVPRLWTDYVKTNLFPQSDLSVFAGNQSGQAAALRQNLVNYRNIGVKYVLTAANQNPFGTEFALSVQPESIQYQGFSTTDHLVVVFAPPSWPLSEIDALSIRVGTYYGRARGNLTIKLCADTNCALGSANLADAGDNQPLKITLNKPIGPLSPHATLTVELTHPDGTPVAITLAEQPDATVIQSSVSQISQYLTPRFSFIDTAATPIFHNNKVDLYALQNAAPYMQTADLACTINIINRQHAITDCPRPSTMIRRELFFSGWRVTVNQHQQAIGLTDQIFQKIDLPEGHSNIRFTYMPLYTRTACALAISALLLWFFCFFRSRKNL